MIQSCSTSLDESSTVFAFGIWPFPRRVGHIFIWKKSPLCARPSRCSRKNSFPFATNRLSIKLWVDLTRTGSYFFLSIENCWFVWSNAVWPLFIIFLKNTVKLLESRKIIVSCPVCTWMSRSRLVAGVWTRCNARHITPFNDEFIDALHGAGEAVLAGWLSF